MTLIQSRGLISSKQPWAWCQDSIENVLHNLETYSLDPVSELRSLERRH